jgi:hypothetical protein
MTRSEVLSGEPKNANIKLYVMPEIRSAKRWSWRGSNGEKNERIMRIDNIEKRRKKGLDCLGKSNAVEQLFANRQIVIWDPRTFCYASSCPSMRLHALHGGMGTLRYICFNLLIHLWLLQGSVGRGIHVFLHAINQIW